MSSSPRIRLWVRRGHDKVVVRITDWDRKSKNPRGEVIDILGKAGDNSTEMHAILAEFGLPYSYPEAVEKACRSTLCRDHRRGARTA